MERGLGRAPLAVHPHDDLPVEVLAHIFSFAERDRATRAELRLVSSRWRKGVAALMEQLVQQGEFRDEVVIPLSKWIDVTGTERFRSFPSKSLPGTLQEILVDSDFFSPEFVANVLDSVPTTLTLRPSTHAVSIKSTTLSRSLTRLHVQLTVVGHLDPLRESWLVETLRHLSEACPSLRMLCLSLSLTGLTNELRIERDLESMIGGCEFRCLEELSINDIPLQLLPPIAAPLLHNLQVCNHWIDTGDSASQRLGLKNLLEGVPPLRSLALCQLEAITSADLTDILSRHCQNLQDFTLTLDPVEDEEGYVEEHDYSKLASAFGPNLRSLRVFGLTLTAQFWSTLSIQSPFLETLSCSRCGCRPPKGREGLRNLRELEIQGVFPFMELCQSDALRRLVLWDIAFPWKWGESDLKCFETVEHLTILDALEDDVLGVRFECYERMISILPNLKSVVTVYESLLSRLLPAINRAANERSLDCVGCLEQLSDENTDETVSTVSKSFSRELKRRRDDLRSQLHQKIAIRYAPAVWRRDTFLRRSLEPPDFDCEDSDFLFDDIQDYLWAGKWFVSFPYLSTTEGGRTVRNDGDGDAPFPWMWTT